MFAYAIQDGANAILKRDNHMRIMFLGESEKLVEISKRRI